MNRYGENNKGIFFWSVFLFIEHLKSGHNLYPLFKVTSNKQEAKKYRQISGKTKKVENKRAQANT